MAEAPVAVPATAVPRPTVSPTAAPSTPEPSTPDDDIAMVSDDGDTPRRQTRAGKCAAAARSSLDEQDAQRLCVDDPVCVAIYQGCINTYLPLQTACGPCKINRRECKPNSGKTKSTACESCANLKIACDCAALKGKGRKRSAIGACPCHQCFQISVTCCRCC